MSYQGQIINIPLGDMGLYTDQSQTITPPQGLLRAENVEIRSGFIEKQPGSRKWNTVALPSPVMAGIDWWPDGNNQRLIAVTMDGRVWRFTDAYHYTEVTPINGGPANLRVTQPPVLVAGGQEEAGNPRKLFIFTGNDPVQVITGDGQVRHTISLGALDWTLSQQPSFGIVFFNRLWAFGNINQPHLLYGSNVTDHEDFQTLGAAVFTNVFPGDSEKLISAYNFKTKFILVKYPFGFYYLDLTDPANPIPQKLGDSFGGSSQNCMLQVLDDLWVGNSSGSISSLTATNALGGLQQQDVVKNMNCFRFLLENVALLKGQDQRTVWYEAKKLAIFSFHSPSGMNIDRMFNIDFQSGKPRATFTTKDQPNCLFLVKDNTLVQRPFYGSTDGFIYQMDQADRNVGGNAYTCTFQTPELDFGFVQRQLAEMNKNFDFLEVTFEPMGDWDLSADIFIDNNFIETVTFNMSQENVLDKNFTLDVSRASGYELRAARKPIHGMGRRISVRFYQSGLNQDIRVSAITFYFRPAGQEQRSA